MKGFLTTARKLRLNYHLTLIHTPKRTITTATPTMSPTRFQQTSGTANAVWVHKDDYTNRPTFQSLKNDTSAQVCIIGSGIAGLSIAYELVSRGKDVTMVEAREVLSGESSRTSGHLSNALDDHYQNIIKKHGREGAQIAADSHTWALNHVGEVARKLNIDCEYRYVPGYLISMYERGDSKHEQDMKFLRDEAEMAKSLGLDVQFRDDVAVKGWDGKPDQRGGAIFAGQAAFHPTRYLVGLMNWLQRQSNFKCYTETRVMAVEEQTDKVTVRTEGGASIVCEQAVEATCIPLQKLSVVAEMEYDRTYVIAVRVPKGSVEDCFIYDTAEKYKYIRLTACDDRDDYMIIGGCDHRVGQEDPTGRYEELERWVRERFPQAGSVDYKWSGQIYEPADFMAFIGLNPGSKRVHIVTGDSGNGLTHGVLASNVISDLIEGKDNPWSKLYSPKRLASLAKSAPTIAANALAINKEYKRFLQSDISDIEDLVPGSGAVLNPTLGKPVAVYKGDDGKIVKMSALCPHMKGVVCWNPAEKTFDCPVHGSRFSNEGLCLNGPAKANLAGAD